MADIEVERERDGTVLERTGFRLSWGAIFAGFVVATMTQIVLSLLGVAVGFTTWDVGDPARDLGMGLGIWMVVSTLASLFVGGLTTGRLAGVLTRGDGAIHGVVMWGIATLVNLWLLVSGAGFFLGGAFDILGRTVAATTSAVAGGVAELGSTAIGEAGSLDAGAVQREIEAALRETGRPGLDPDTLRAEAEDVGRRATARGVSNEQLAREIAGTVRERAGRVDREAIINVVTARTELTREEAGRVADRIERMAGAAGTQVAAGVEQAESAVTDAAGAATEALGRAAWWTLLALLLGAAAAAGGAAMTAKD